MHRSRAVKASSTAAAQTARVFTYPKALLGATLSISSIDFMGPIPTAGLASILGLLILVVQMPRHLRMRSMLLTSFISSRDNR
jgi:hypothetical protein